MTHRVSVLLLTAALASVSLAARCQVPGPPVLDAQKTSLAFVTNNPSDYWTLCRKGTEAAAKELGNVTVRFVMPADGTAGTQQQVVSDLLNEGVKGIAISPVDPANETGFLNGVAARATLITSDSDAPESSRLCYVGSDNRAAGLQAGRLLRNALPQGGQIMLFVGRRDARNAADREAGIREALRGSRIRILAVREDDADHARAQSNAADALIRYPHIAALVGLWSYNGPAIASAVEKAGKTRRVKIVCFGDENDTLADVRSGAIYATVVQQPYEFGYQSTRLLAALAAGDRRSLPCSGRLIVPTLAISKANLAEYESTQAARLGRTPAN